MRYGRAAVFLDRDGVLIEDTGHPHDPEAMVLLPGVVEALHLLQEDGYRLVVVTNQAGVAKGIFSIETCLAMHARLVELLTAESIELDALYFCPHHVNATVPEFRGACSCRKPNAGMLYAATRWLDLDPTQCWIVGDKETDIAAGKAIGCRAVLVGPRISTTAAEHQCDNLLEAAAWITVDGYQGLGLAKSVLQRCREEIQGELVPGLVMNTDDISGVLEAWQSRGGPQENLLEAIQDAIKTLDIHRREARVRT